MIKAVIPVAGPGTKLRPHTHTQPKPLIPVAGKPILGHIIESLESAGIKDFVFIVGYLGEKIENWVRENYEGRIGMEFVVQSPQEGLGHAIWTAREKIIDTDEILIVLGDTIFDVDLKRILDAPQSVVAVQEVADPRIFGVVDVDENGWVTTVVEKPKIPKSNLALVGIYKIREVKDLISCLDENLGKKETTGPFHLSDGLMCMVLAGIKIGTVSVDNWFDCGKVETLLQTNKILLERSSLRPEYSFPGTVIIHPVTIAPNCEIFNSIIGPFVAIGENAIIKDSIVRNSLIGAWAELGSIILDGSVIGNDSVMKGKSHSINIGDNTQIDFNE